MIQNLGRYAHPKKNKAKSLMPVIGNQKPYPAPPKSKPDPVNMNVMDVSMTGATPGTGAMPKGTIPSANLAARGAGKGTATKPPAKKMSKGPVNKRAKKAAKPFFGSY